MGHVPQETPFDARPQIRLPDLRYSLDRPLNKFWNLNEARLSRLAVHDNDDKVVHRARALEAHGQARARCRCNACLYARVSAERVLLPQDGVCICPTISHVAVDARL